MNYTKGEWKVAGAFGTTIVSETGEFIATTTSIFAEPRERPKDEANAHLIAAAPEMYEALRTALADLEEDVQAPLLDSVKLAKRALAKVEGK